MCDNVTQVRVHEVGELKALITCANEDAGTAYAIDLLEANITLMSAWGTSLKSQSESGLWIGPNTMVSINGIRSGGGTSQIVGSQSGPKIRLIYVSRGARLSMENLVLRDGGRRTEGEAAGFYVSNYLLPFLSRSVVFKGAWLQSCSRVEPLVQSSARTRCIYALIPNAHTFPRVFRLASWLEQGGALYVHSSGSVDLKNCTLRGNMGDLVSSVVPLESFSRLFLSM